MKVKKIIKKMKSGENVRIKNVYGDNWINTTVGNEKLYGFLENKVAHIESGEVINDGIHSEPTLVIFIHGWRK